MGLNRNFLIGQNVDLKNIKAMMTVGKGYFSFGFTNGSYGSLSPNPLPNGVLVTSCYNFSGNFILAPSSIKSCTINDIIVSGDTAPDSLVSYLQENNGKTIPVIFHFG